MYYYYDKGSQLNIASLNGDDQGDLPTVRSYADMMFEERSITDYRLKYAIMSNFKFSQVSDLDYYEFIDSDKLETNETANNISNFMERLDKKYEYFKTRASYREFNEVLNKIFMKVSSDELNDEYNKIMNSKYREPVMLYNLLAYYLAF